MYNKQLSKEIFDQLTNGKVINKTILNNAGEFVENHLFNEVMGNLNDYRQQYEMSGCDFVESPTFVFIRDLASNQEDLKTDVTMKACVLLLLIGKYITENNYRITKLTESSGGLTEADIEAIEQMDDTKEVLERSSIKNGFSSAIKSILIDRNILLKKPSVNAYLLSDAGKEFFDEISERFQN
jgi:hypothetical protein